MATPYAELLRARHAMRLLAGTLIGRLPNATAALAIVLFTRAEGGGYPLAGAFAAVYGLSNAVGQPLLGRAVDILGQPRVMFPAAVLSALGMTGFALGGIDPPWAAHLWVLLAGLATPPLEGGLRALWPSVLRGEDRVHAAYALDAVAQELMFAVGPLVVTLSVAVGDERFALLAINLLGLFGAFSVVVSPPSRAWKSAPREAHWLGALRSGGLKVLLGAFFFVGLALGSIAVAAVAYADAHHRQEVASYLLAALGAGALVGGLLYGARQWAGDPEPRLRLLVALLAAGYLPLALAPGPVWMTLLAGLSGVFLAPALACAFVVIDRHAPSGTVTEAFSWLVTTFGVGASAGTALVGPVVEWRGSGAGFAVAGVGGLAAVLVLAVSGRVLSAATARVVTSSVQSENDRNGDLDPGFRTRHQA
ncbi:MFS transporter [Streptomyces sp. NPDC005438]|uniref:MFS transporter n=1 Tax=Streptomyces sp. NPDC005438 TaxID=3156880 RepID=UPI0033A428D0